MNSVNSEDAKIDKKKPRVINIELPSFYNPEESTSSESKSTSKESTSISDQEIETNSDEKIMELVKRSSEMKENVKEKDLFMEEKFNELKSRINSSVAFLRTTKNQIENIKFMHQKDVLNMTKDQNIDYSLENTNQSVEELNLQMEEIQKKLNKVREQTKKYKEAHTVKISNDQNYQAAVTKTVNLLDRVGRGDYSVNEATKESH